VKFVMNSKIDKTNSASAKKKTAAGVPPNQPKITLFLTKQDGSNQAPPMSRRKRRRRNRHTGPSSSTPGMVLAEITLSSDSDDDMARPNSIHLKRPRTILECAADDGEEKGNSREASDASSTAAEEDAEIICDAGLSSHPRKFYFVKQTNAWLIAPTDYQLQLQVFLGTTPIPMLILKF